MRKTDYTKYSLDKLLKTLDEISTGDFWLKNQQNLSRLMNFLKKNFRLK